MHYRQVIREAFQAALNSVTLAGNSVYLNRCYPIQKTDVPAIIIYTSNEDAEIATIGTPGTSMRELILTIEIYVKTQNNPDNQIDIIAEQIEIAIADNTNLNSLAKCIDYQGIEIEENGDGDKKFYIGTMSYSVIYRVLKNDPSQNN